jgi:YidC/Oxa1 family membrane protein insertase
MPIFIAMYQTVTRILVPGGYWAEKISNTRFLGVDLSIGSHWASSYILAALVGITMLLLQWISQRKPAHLKKTTEHKKDDQAAQTARTMKIVSYIMVIMMVFFAFRSNALALYWVIGNLFSLGQTLIHRQLAKKRYEKKQEETLGGIL